ncbi:MAG: hypothetical protein JWO48_2540 [Bryobacterales bacterium]|nr:hypothetical protein [Bryobacterales bacterium]
MADNQSSTPGQQLPAAHRIALLLLVAQPLIFFRSVLFHPQSHIPFDIEGFHLPLAAYIGRCVREGILPLWDPYPYCGMPIHADFQAQLFYPFTWISILLGNLSAGARLLLWLEWLVPFHMILAGVFTFLLLRQLGTGAVPAFFGGTVYQLGGFFVSQAQHLGVICCGAWLPLVLLCVLKLGSEITIRWICALALSVALTILAGSSAAASVVLVAAALFAIGLFPPMRRNWKLFGALLAGLAAAACITAVQIVPTYQLTRQSIATLRSEWHVTGGGLRLQSLPSLFWPNYYHIFTPNDPSLYKVPINFVFLYVYCGIIALALVLLAPFLRRTRYAKLLFSLTVISAVWMLGDETPVYRFIYTHLPRLLRGALYAEFALMAFCMFVALTSAIALERLAARAPKTVLWVIALATSADLIYFGSGRPMNSAPGSYSSRSSEYTIDGYSGGLVKMQNLVNTASPPLRIDYVDKEFYQGIWGSEMIKLPTADGDNPFMLRRLLLLRRLFCSGSDWERQIPVSRLDSPLINMLNVGFLAGRSGLSPDQLRGTRLQPAGEIAGVRFYRNPGVLPRFFLVPRLHISSGPDETFSYLSRPDFRPEEEAVVEARGLRPDQTLSTGVTNVERYSPNRIELSVSTNGPAFLVSSEAHYPGWSATINGKPAPLYMTNGAFRGLLLESGANHVVMTYWPERFLAWAAISIVSLLFVIAGLMVPIWRWRSLIRR